MNKTTIQSLNQVLVLTSVLLILSACGRSNSKPSASPSEVTPNEKIDIGSSALEMNDQELDVVIRRLSLIDSRSLNPKKFGLLLDRNYTIQCNPNCTIRRK